MANERAGSELTPRTPQESQAQLRAVFNLLPRRIVDETDLGLIIERRDVEGFGKLGPFEEELWIAHNRDTQHFVNMIGEVRANSNVLKFAVGRIEELLTPVEVTGSFKGQIVEFYRHAFIEGIDKSKKGPLKDPIFEGLVGVLDIERRKSNGIFEGKPLERERQFYLIYKEVYESAINLAKRAKDKEIGPYDTVGFEGPSWSLSPGVLGSHVMTRDFFERWENDFALKHGVSPQ